MVSGKCSDETTLLFANALKDFYIADKIICKSDLNDFKNIIKGIKDPKLKIKTILLQTVAQNMMNSADRHLKKGLVVPPAVEYRICHRQYVDALKLNGIVFVRTTVIELDQTEITPNLPDTDGDGLPDGYEYNLLQTNPAEKDTDKNGTEDGQEDIDLDELANAQEYSAGTNPLVADTDLDGLLDAEEINVYQTNPLLYDTDGDGLSDGDEVKLGLSPLTQYTHDGILDSEYKVEQHLPEEALTAVNTEDNDYELSIDIKAAGCVENNLDANESIYSDTLMENRAILGVAADLGYFDGAIESAKLKFQIKTPFVDNTGSIYAANDGELVGIKRYNIFKYFAEDNMLLPIKIIDYQLDGKNFSGTLHFNIYDHFGLDKPDAEKFAALAGFRAWFVLQHYDQLNGVYDPFATLMEFDIPFNGRIYTWEQG